MGVVVNRSLGKHLGELGGDFALGPLAGIPLFHGGPVQPEQIILAAWQKREAGFQLHMGVEPDKAGSLLAEEDTSVRAFLGYAGWSAGQLGKELKQNTWVVVDPPSDLFAHPGDVMLWRRVLAREGDQWRLLADEPDNPEQN
jgi:putative transcriptional regulator